MLRRGSMALTGGGEPLIVVEESGAEEAEAMRTPEPQRGYSIDTESPPDPYHLSPWRDTRKHSLPTPSCTTGPTASQVRRLSERGEGAAREAREAAFLATLSQVQPQPGGRRHSVVTISRVPQSLFGRGRRESIAAFPALGRRRDSVTKKCTPATETLGSTHNLQLDIMDDIVQARKVRMRLWNTSNERVCEVQPLDERSPMAGSVRYTNRGRRHSDFVGSPLPPIPARRRASEMPPPIPPRTNTAAAGGPGVVCTDTDLNHILNALTSSATEIDRCGRPERPPPRRLADMRSSSFDASTLREKSADSGATWFARRHQTLATKNKETEPKKSKVTFAPDAKQAPDDAAAVVWDKPTGSVVDASALGSAIEVFLRKSGAGVSEPGPSTSASVPKVVVTGGNGAGSVVGVGSATERWSHPEEEDKGSGCDATLCSSLKDLFV
ncbi:hypothetical protein O0L34_g4376 [Tuta absoluta]|nr:hypothetical protein O0L34_g4376 [Tuta absoluta]